MPATDDTESVILAYNLNIVYIFREFTPTTTRIHSGYLITSGCGQRFISLPLTSIYCFTSLKRLGSQCLQTLNTIAYYLYSFLQRMELYRFPFGTTRFVRTWLHLTVPRSPLALDCSPNLSTTDKLSPNYLFILLNLDLGVKLKIHFVTNLRIYIILCYRDQ